MANGTKVLVIATISACVVLAIVMILRSRKQSSTVNTSSNIPPPGIYSYADSILGQKINLTINIALKAPGSTTGTFDFHMTDPYNIQCPASTWTYNESKQALDVQLSDCLVKALETHDLILSSVKYSNDSKKLTGSILFKKVVPIDIPMQYQPPPPPSWLFQCRQRCQVHMNTTFLGRGRIPGKSSSTARLGNSWTAPGKCNQHIARLRNGLVAGVKTWVTGAQRRVLMLQCGLNVLERRMP